MFELFNGVQMVVTLAGNHSEAKMSFCRSGVKVGCLCQSAGRFFISIQVVKGDPKIVETLERVRRVFIDSCKDTGSLLILFILRERSAQGEKSSWIRCCHALDNGGQGTRLPRAR